MISTPPAEWCDGQTRTCFCPPGQPWGNPFVESFGSRLRDECLNLHSFWSLIHARVTITDWKETNNHDRPSRRVSRVEIHYLITAGTKASITRGGVVFISVEDLQAYCARHAGPAVRLAPH